MALNLTILQGPRAGRSSARWRCCSWPQAPRPGSTSGPSGPYVLAAGLGLLAYMLFGWFGTVIKESEGGLYNQQVDVPFVGDGLVHRLRGDGLRRLLRRAVLRAAVDSAVARRRGRQFLHECDAVAGIREQLAVGGTGARFRRTNGRLGHTRAQHGDSAHERRHDHDRAPHAAREPARPVDFLARRNVRARLRVHCAAGGGVHPRVYRARPAPRYRYLRRHFFHVDGFHGLHVTLGAIMLVVIWLRVLRGHFTPQRHFAFEAVAWYWHFVDVVWLGLFFFVYWV